MGWCMPIVLNDVYAGYRKGQQVLRGITCTLTPRTLILGPNGAGKTTLFRVLLGLTPLAKGRVLIDDIDINRISGVKGLLTANLEEIWSLLWLPIKDIAKLYIDIVGGDLDRFRELVKTFRVEHTLNKKMNALSAGEKRIVLNSLALSLDTKYVLLDEPFENLDPRARATMLKIILEEGHRIIMNTHATWLLDRLESWRTYIMVAGRVFGCIDATELPKLGIVEGVDPKAKLVIEVDDRKLSLVEGSGLPISRMDSLDRLYEVITL